MKYAIYSKIFFQICVNLWPFEELILRFFLLWKWILQKMPSDFHFLKKNYSIVCRFIMYTENHENFKILQLFYVDLIWITIYINTFNECLEPGPVHFADNHFADAVLPTDCFADRYFLPTFTICWQLVLPPLFVHVSAY